MNKTSEKIVLSAIIPEESAGLRLDQALSRLFPNYSRSLLQNWIRAEHITVDDKKIRPRDKVSGGESIIINASLENQGPWEAEAIQLEVVYEDNAVLVINKPVGLVVHPGAGHWQGTLVNALLNHAPELRQLPRAGLIHRLDKETSGLLVVAKTITAHTHLTKEMQKRNITREYEAIVNGVMTAGGTVDAPISRHSTHRQRMAVTDTDVGKPAVTHYRVLTRFRAHTYLKVQLETGRTHQIRAHMSHIRHPLVGDSLYGGHLKIAKGASPILLNALKAFRHQALHAKRLELTHPETKKQVEWVAPLPEEMKHLIQLLTEDTLVPSRI